MLGLGLSLVSIAVRQLLGFSPATLFGTSDQGVWYDPSDYSTLFQDSAGTTPVTALEQPVGLMLDKSKGLVLGPELVVNGTFDDGTTTGWSSTGLATLSVVSGRMRVTTTGDSYAGFPFSTTVGVTYKFVVGSAQNISGNIRTRIGTHLGGFTQVNQTIAGENIVYYFTATTTTTWVNLGSSVASVNEFDNISVRELPGNHAFQPTATSRPVVSARKNILVNTEALATQTRAVRAVGHILSFWGTGTVTLSGVSTAGPLVGTGAGNRVYVEFTPTAGNLTLTVSGTVTKAQLEETNESL